MYYFALCFQDLIEIFTTESILHVNITENGRRILIRLSSYGEINPNSCFSSFRDSLSLALSNLLISIFRPSRGRINFKKCQLYSISVQRVTCKSSMAECLSISHPFNKSIRKFIWIVGLCITVGRLWFTCFTPLRLLDRISIWIRHKV